MITIVVSNVNRHRMNDDITTRQDFWSGSMEMMREDGDRAVNEVSVDMSDFLDGGLSMMNESTVVPSTFVSTSETSKTSDTTNIRYLVEGDLQHPRGERRQVNMGLTEIDWSFFPVRRIQNIHVFTFAARTHSADQLNDDVLKAKRNELEMMRKSIREYARNAIQIFFIQGFREMCMRKGLLQLRDSINSLQDIIKYHKENCDTKEGKIFVLGC